MRKPKLKEKRMIANKEIKIFLDCFWGEINNKEYIFNNYILFKILKEINKNVSLVDKIEEADIVFVSVFAKFDKNQHKLKHKDVPVVSILYEAYNWPWYFYNNHFNADFSFSFDDNSDNNCNLSGLTSLKSDRFNSMEEYFYWVDDTLNKNKTKSTENKNLACSVISARSMFRDPLFLYAANFFKDKMKNGGTLFNNIGSKIKHKETLLDNSLFNFCPENCISKNYITEKIIDSYICGCVPIYSGSKDVFKIFNEKSMIYLDLGNFDNFSKVTTESFLKYKEENILINKDYYKIMYSNIKDLLTKILTKVL